MRLLALCLLPVLAQAAPIYKSTDANGHVTYSADAPAPQSGDQVEMLTPDPSPRENTSRCEAKRMVFCSAARSSASSAR